MSLPHRRFATESLTLSTPLPEPPPLPPPPPSDGPRVRVLSVSTAASSNDSPTRIRRKPLPTTAFSPRSAISSPESLYSHYADDSPLPLAASAATVALSEVFNAQLLAKPPTDAELPVEHLVTAPNEKALPQPPPFGADLGAHSLQNPDHVVTPPRSTDADLSEDSINQARMLSRTTDRPPPLRMDSLQAVKAIDTKKPQSPGGVFTSFFSRKQQAISPQNTSLSDATDISDGRSPILSPFPMSTEDSPTYLVQTPTSHRTLDRQNSSDDYQQHSRGRSVPSAVANRCNALEAELKEISRELAGSIRREIDLEDLVERLQSEAPPLSTDRTSDYFSDSGTSSVRHNDSAPNPKDEIDKIRRESEQKRAQIRVELSQKWQDEVSQRKLLESHVAILEEKLSLTRKDTNDSVDASARVRELENALDDHRRRLQEERQTKENFEDLLTALKVDLEQHRNERDNLRDEIVPQLRAQIEGLEANAAEHQRQPYDYARMQQELQHLRDENAAITSARKMEQEMMRGMGQIAEDDDLSAVRSSLILPRGIGLHRSNTTGRTSAQASLSGSGSLSRANSIINKGLPDTPESITDKMHAVEQQRDALHSTAKYLRNRLAHETTKYEKHIRSLQAELQKVNGGLDGTRRGGYDLEVRGLRQEINLLRRRADDALDQKDQCEKGLAGLRMDLDRSKQETESLQKLLQARDSDDPELLSGALEQAINDLQSYRTRSRESLSALEHEAQMSRQLEDSAARSESLAAQVRQQLEANSSLRLRLKAAVEHGERNQSTSASQISQLQSKLRRLEDTITSAQIQSETAVMKHEEELRSLKETRNTQLQRSRASYRSPQSPFARSPMSPMLANSKKSPQLEQTSSGPGQSLHEVLKTENLQKKVSELEKALNEAESGMEDVVGRMNQAQIGVFELQQERDEALKRTRQLELEVKAERERFQMIVTGGAGQDYTTLS